MLPRPSEYPFDPGNLSSIRLQDLLEALDMQFEVAPHVFVVFTRHDGGDLVGRHPLSAQDERGPLHVDRSIRVCEHRPHRRNSHAAPFVRSATRRSVATHVALGTPQSDPLRTITVSASGAT